VLDDFLRRQDGVITLAEARSAGLSQDSINRRVRAGRWRRCAPGVYFVDDRPFSAAARIRAAVWSYGPRAAASGLAAAWWHGLVPTAPDTVEVTIPRAARLSRRAGTRVRRRDLPMADVVERRDLRVTALALTVVEAAVRSGGGPSIMDSALQRRAELPELQRAHLRNSGRHGAPAARRLLEAASGGARSQAERLLIALLRGAGITGWRTNYPVGGYLVDVAFPAHKLAIEVDGWAFHSDHEAFHNDRVRQNRIALRGWQVLRFTWRDLTTRPEQVVAEIQSAICGV